MTPQTLPQTHRILGSDFFDGSAKAAIGCVIELLGKFVCPSDLIERDSLP